MLLMKKLSFKKSVSVRTFSRVGVPISKLFFIPNKIPYIPISKNLSTVKCLNLAESRHICGF